VISDECTLEYSVPKFIRGYNVNDDDINLQHLYDSAVAIHSILSKIMNVPDVLVWRILRLDYCFNYYHLSSQAVINKLSRRIVPRKKKSTYDTSVMFVGSTYTIKYYLKQPEYKKHDFSRIAKRSLQFANQLFNECENIIRFEISIRPKMLYNIFGIKFLKLNDLLTATDTSKLDSIVNNGLHRIQRSNFDNSTLKELLVLKYGKNKGARLYFFYIAMFSNKSRFLLTSSVSRTTIYRNTKLINAVYESTD